MKKLEKIKVDFSLNPLDQLKQLVQNYPFSYFSLLARNEHLQDLAKWINQQTPFLQDKFYKWSTKIYWILNGIKDFPKCQNPNCGKPLLRNVNLVDGYAEFHCCHKCAMEDPQKTQRLHHTNELRHGDKNWNNPKKISRSRLTMTKQQKENQARKIHSTRAKHLEEDPDFNKKIDAKIRATKVKNGHSPTWNNPEKNRETLSNIKEKIHGFCLS